MEEILTPALPSLVARRPREPGESASVTASTSSSVTGQPCWAQTFFAAAGLSTTIQIIPEPCPVAAARPTMLIFFAPNAPATSPSMPGWSGTVRISCFAFGIETSSSEPQKKLAVSESQRGSAGQSLRADTQPECDQHGAEQSVDRPSDAVEAEPAAHALDGEGVAHEPDKGQQAEVEAQREQKGKARVRTREGRKKADEEGDHLGVR